ncbi:MAG: formate dehydrogenase [Rhodopseudomonas sp.]|nr:formate dehydrogenase [Rhodopseudomonas sp.]
MNNEQAESKRLDRRSLLKGASFTLGAGVATATAKAAVAAPAETDQQRVTGYRETEHVRTYYKSARF